MRNCETSLAFMLAKDQIASRRATWLLPGGPEAFANICREAARAIRAEGNVDLTPEVLDFPTIDGGLEGMVFITMAVQSAKAGDVLAKMPASSLAFAEITCCPATYEYILFAITDRNAG